MRAERGFGEQLGRQRIILAGAPFEARHFGLYPAKAHRLLTAQHQITFLKIAEQMLEDRERLGIGLGHILQVELQLEIKLIAIRKEIVGLRHVERFARGRVHPHAIHRTPRAAWVNRAAR